MRIFTTLILSCAAVISAAGTTISPVDHLSSPKKSELLTAAKSKIEAHRLQSQRISPELRAINAETPRRKAASALINESFAWCVNGSEEEPQLITLEEGGYIPESLIGAKNYGFGGDILGEAGGSLFVANDDFDGFMFSPDFVCNGEFSVTFQAKPVGDLEYLEYDFITCDAFNSSTHLKLKSNYEPLKDGWKQYSFTFGAQKASKIYIEIYTDWCDVVIKDLTIAGEQMALDAPLATSYTDFTANSFTANWRPVEGATGYKVTAYEWDDENHTPMFPYLASAKLVEGTSCVIEGSVPGNIYHYFVVATNGTDDSNPSNEVTVAALETPTDVKGGPFGNLPSVFQATCADVTAANRYLFDFYRKYVGSPEGDNDVVLYEADFSEFSSSGTVEAPFEPLDDMTYYPEELRSWVFVMPLMVNGGIGVTDEEFFASFGFPGMIQSSTLDLSGAKDGKVKVAIEAASNLNNHFEAFIAYYNAEVDNYVIATPYVSPAGLTAEFQKFEFTLSGATDKCFICLRPVSIDVMGRKEGNMFLRSIVVKADSKPDGTFILAEGFTRDDEPDVIFDFENHAAPFYMVSATAMQVAYEQGEPYTRLVSQPSAPALLDKHNAVEAISGSNDADVRYFNLQGMPIDNPTAGQLLIRRQGSEVSKIIVK